MMTYRRIKVSLGVNENSCSRISSPPRKTPLSPRCPYPWQLASWIYPDQLIRKSGSFWSSKQD